MKIGETQLFSTNRVFGYVIIVLYTRVLINLSIYNRRKKDDLVIVLLADTAWYLQEAVPAEEKLPFHAYKVGAIEDQYILKAIQTHGALRHDLVRAHAVKLRHLNRYNGGKWGKLEEAVYHVFAKCESGT